LSTARPKPGERTASSPVEVLFAFLRLGLTSFGGPIAHLGYFRAEFVVRRQWLDDHAFADLAALCQLLPGPASSQVGYSIGLLRAGYLGGIAAWIGFTLPSAIAMVCFAYGARALTGPIAVGALHGLMLVAVPVVAQALIGMARALCPDPRRAGIAIVVTLLACIGTSAIGQVAAIAGGALAGLLLVGGTPAVTASGTAVPVSRRAGWIALIAFAALLAGLPLLRQFTDSTRLALFDAFYRAGALVFGGGHVVLPLLREAIVTPGWTSESTFLAGYGAAQAVPGPLFTFAAYLGAVVGTPANGVAGAAIGLIGLSLPGLLLVTGVLPFWDAFRGSPRVQAAMRGAGAAVVGLLAAALYDPVWTRSVLSPADFAVAFVGFALLMVGRVPALLVCVLSAIAGAAGA
jgi:chromate transporter